MNYYKTALFLIFGSTVLVFILLFYLTAPYGKFLRKGWGPSLKSWQAWMLMEFPSPALMIWFFISSTHRNPVHYLFLLAWLSHYLYRTFFYPFLHTGRNKPYPLILVFMAIVFNCLNGFVNGYGLFHLIPYEPGWICSWQFISGTLLFAVGFIINKTADRKLMQMRRVSPEEYVIPEGWLFNYVSSPHYLGEIIEWSGWALMTFSLPGLAFALFTFANLFPRAVASHQWYKNHFRNYPSERKAIIPFMV